MESSIKIREATSPIRLSLDTSAIKKIHRRKTVTSPKNVHYELNFDNFQTKTKVKGDTKRMSCEKVNEDIEFIMDKPRPGTKKFESKFDYLTTNQRQLQSRGVKNPKQDIKSQTRQVFQHHSFKLDVDYLEDYKNKLLENLENIERDQKSQKDLEMAEIKELIHEQTSMFKSSLVQNPPSYSHLCSKPKGSVKHKSEKLAPLNGPQSRLALQEKIIRANQENFDTMKIARTGPQSPLSSNIISHKTSNMFYETHNMHRLFGNNSPLDNVDSDAYILSDNKIIKDSEFYSSNINQRISGQHFRNRTNPVSPKIEIHDVGEEELLVSSDNEEIEANNQYTRYQSFFNMRNKKNQKAPVRTNNPYSFPSIQTPNKINRKQYEDQLASTTPIHMRRTLNFSTKNQQIVPQISKLELDEDNQQQSGSSLSFLTVASLNKRYQKNSKNGIIVNSNRSSDLSTIGSNEDGNLPFYVKK